MHALIADAGFGVVIGLVVLLAVLVTVAGVIAVCVAMIGFMFKLSGGVLRAVFGGSRPYVEKRPYSKSPSQAVSRTAGGRKECHNKRCGCSNPVAAVYCARCGQRF